jgi:hypothetical protein
MKRRKGLCNIIQNHPQNEGILEKTDIRFLKRVELRGVVGIQEFTCESSGR